MQFDNLLGLPLNVARASIEGEVVVLSTTPPFWPRGYTPHWGVERVLRAHALADGKVELLVACELVGEERMAFKDKRSSHNEKSGSEEGHSNR